jgi:hypothetical protein
MKNSNQNNATNKWNDLIIARLCLDKKCEVRGQSSQRTLLIKWVDMGKNELYILANPSNKIILDFRVFSLFNFNQW